MNLLFVKFNTNIFLNYVIDPYSFKCFLVMLGFELKALYSLGRCSTTCTTLLA
jgi:hypothetical protein